eukprot:Gb_09836 [translate_table: standard]
MNFANSQSQSEGVEGEAEQRMENNQNEGKPISNNASKKRFGAVYRCIKALSPLPYLVRARNYYVRSMTECAGRANYSGIAAGPYGGGMNLPKSFSTNSARERDEDEMGELIRAASQRSRSMKSDSNASSEAFPRSFSTATVGRIDEDSPCYFPGSFRKTVNESDLLYGRSRSYSSAETFKVHRRIPV